MTIMRVHQLNRIERRSLLLLHALRAFYLALGSFAASALVSLLGAILATSEHHIIVVTPRVVGSGVGLHPVLALFALVIGGALFQLSGMLLSVPIAGSIQVILFRLFPHLTAPTPAGFLRAQGVPLGQRESVKILEGDQSA